MTPPHHFTCGNHSDSPSALRNVISESAGMLLGTQALMSFLKLAFTCRMSLNSTGTNSQFKAKSSLKPCGQNIFTCVIHSEQNLHFKARPRITALFSLKNLKYFGVFLQFHNYKVQKVHIDTENSGSIHKVHTKYACVVFLLYWYHSNVCFSYSFPHCLPAALLRGTMGFQAESIWRSPM